MNIPANDAISLNSRSHRRRSVTRSPPPKRSFFAPSPPQPRQAVRKHPMSLRHRPLANGVVSTSEHSANGDARGVVEEKHLVTREDSTAKDRSTPPVDWEIPRKLFHSSIGFFVIPLYTNHVPATSVAVVLSAAFAVIAPVDFVRLRNKRFAAFYERALGFLMRESEKEQINGVIWYLLGCTFVLTSYPEDIAVVSILILSWCDTAASTFGRLYGSRTSRLPQSFRVPFIDSRIPLPFARRKSVAGCLAGSATGVFIAFGFWRWLVPLGAAPASLPEIVLSDLDPVPSSVKLSCIALVIGLLAGFTEALDIGSLDDNLTLPIISGGLIWALFKVVEYIFQ